MTDTKTVLVVDDSLFARQMLRAIMTELLPGWTVKEAKDYDSALLVAEEGHLDLATVDLNMPGTDGIGVATALQQKFDELPIAIVTANIQKAVRDRVEEIGVTLIEKPITEDKIKGFLEVQELCDA